MRSCCAVRRTSSSRWRRQSALLPLAPAVVLFWRSLVSSSYEDSHALRSRWTPHFFVPCTPFPRPFNLVSTSFNYRRTSRCVVRCFLCHLPPLSARTSLRNPIGSRPMRATSRTENLTSAARNVTMFVRHCTNKHCWKLSEKSKPESTCKNRFHKL